MNFFQALAGIAGVGGDVLRGYGADKAERAKQLIAQQKMAEEQRAARVQEALAQSTIKKNASDMGKLQILNRGDVGVDPVTRAVVAHGSAPEPNYDFVTNNTNQRVRVNKDTLQSDVVPGVTVREAADPAESFGKMAEKQHQQMLAENWQKVYMHHLTPQRDKYGDVVDGTGLTPAEAAERADEAMGGHPLLAPRISAPRVPPIPQMGTVYTPSTSARP